MRIVPATAAVKVLQAYHLLLFGIAAPWRCEESLHMSNSETSSRHHCFLAYAGGHTGILLCLLDLCVHSWVLACKGSQGLQVGVALRSRNRHKDRSQEMRRLLRHRPSQVVSLGMEISGAWGLEPWAPCEVEPVPAARSKDEDEGSSATGSVARRPRRREAWTGEAGQPDSFLRGREDLEAEKINRLGPSMMASFSICLSSRSSRQLLAWQTAPDLPGLQH